MPELAQLTKQHTWREIGTIKNPAATLTTGATYAYFSGENKLNRCALLEIPYDWNVVELRFRTAANADAHSVEIWTGSRDSTGEVYFDREGVLALTGGAAVAPGGGTFVSAIVVTDDEAPGSGIVTRGHLVERAALDVFGGLYLAVIAPTLGAILRVEARGI
jgi:hypothetical protein